MTNENSSLKELFDSMGELFSNTFDENLLPKTNSTQQLQSESCADKSTQEEYGSCHICSHGYTNGHCDICGYWIEKKENNKNQKI